MAFLNKISRTSSNFLRIYGYPFINHVVGDSTVKISEKTGFFCPRSVDRNCTVRHFAVPAQFQAKPKPEEKDTNGPRLNQSIKADFVRLVTDEGHSVVSIREALARAKQLKLDLVEVQRHAKPPVCKLMDYGKEKFEQQQREKERSKSKTAASLRGECKEIRFTVKCELKDLKVKAEMAKKQMDRGYRVKCMAMGKEEEDLGGLLSRFSELIEDVASIESGPKTEKRQAYMVVKHIKFCSSKKGPGKDKVEESTNSETSSSTCSDTVHIDASSSDGILKNDGHNTLRLGPQMPMSRTKASLNEQKNELPTEETNRYSKKSELKSNAPVEGINRYAKRSEQRTVTPMEGTDRYAKRGGELRNSPPIEVTNRYAMRGESRNGTPIEETNRYAKRGELRNGSPWVQKKHDYRGPIGVSPQSRLPQTVPGMSPKAVEKDTVSKEDRPLLANNYGGSDEKRHLGIASPELNESHPGSQSSTSSSYGIFSLRKNPISDERTIKKCSSDEERNTGSPTKDHGKYGVFSR